MRAEVLLTELNSAVPLVGPSLLACDFAHLEDEIRRCEEAGARLLHLDIMDGHFVPNLSFGLPLVEAIRRTTKLPLDVHLMIANPESYLKRFREAGADLLTIHVETAPQPRRLLEEIRRMGGLAGVAINPPTPLEPLLDVLDVCDLVLVMSVMPGFGGQSFNPVALDKLRRLAALARPETLLSVDGGINPETIARCADAGARLFVVGTAFFSHPDYRQRMTELRGSALARKTCV